MTREEKLAHCRIYDGSDEINHELIRKHRGYPMLRWWEAEYLWCNDKHVKYYDELTETVKELYHYEELLEKSAINKELFDSILQRTRVEMKSFFDNEEEMASLFVNKLFPFYVGSGGEDL